VKIRALLFITTLLAVSATIAASETGEGVIRGIDRNNNSLTIDEMTYSGLYTTLITGLGDGSSQLRQLQIGDPVRFELDINGKLRQLWVYPRNSEARAEHGYGSDENRE